MYDARPTLLCSNNHKCIGPITTRSFSNATVHTISDDKILKVYLTNYRRGYFKRGVSSLYPNQWRADPIVGYDQRQRVKMYDF